jgi:hypothetical protein
MEALKQHTALRRRAPVAAVPFVLLSTALSMKLLQSRLRAPTKPPCTPAYYFDCYRERIDGGWAALLESVRFLRISSVPLLLIYLQIAFVNDIDAEDKFSLINYSDCICIVKQSGLTLRSRISSNSFMSAGVFYTYITARTALWLWFLICWCT